MEDKATLASDLSAVLVTIQQGRAARSALFSALLVVPKAINALLRQASIVGMRDNFLNRFAADVSSMMTPGVVRSRLMGFLFLLEVSIDLFASEHLSLALLLAEDRVI